jgi:hypothetical protein
MASKIPSAVTTHPNGPVENIDIGRLNTDGTFSRRIPGTRRMTRTPEAIVWSRFSGTTSPQVKVMTDILETIWRQEKFPATVANQVLYTIRCEECDFRSADPLPDGSQNWRKTKVRFIYPHTVKINAAFRKRAERHVRETLTFFRMCDAYATYQERKPASTRARMHA